MDFSSICRFCLRTKYLTPIFEDKNHSNRICATVHLVIGLKVIKNDGLPQKMCRRCQKRLDDTLKFRQQCHDADTQLLSIYHGQYDTVTNSLQNTDNFKHSKLKHKRPKVDKNNGVKVEKYIFNNDDKIPLKNLFKTITDNNTEIVKTETEFLQPKTNDIQDTTKLIKDENITKKEENEEESTNQEEIINCITSKSEEIKYEEEYLDLHFESDYESENVAHKDPNSSKDISLNDAITGPKEKSLNDAANSKKASLNDLTNTENIPYIVHNLKRVTCKLCQKDLSIRSIDTHMAKKHPGADSRKVKCELCDAYVLKSRLNRHKIVRHGLDSFRCGYCKMEFDNTELLIAHVPLCTAKKRKRNTTDTNKRKELKVECDVCHKVMQKASIRMHKQIKHAGMGPVCEHCGRRFGNKFRLHEHLRAKHGYDKFKCSQCDFLSASTMAMKNHERRHRGEKPFACTVCDAKFHAAYLLAQHKLSHRTDKPMKCDQCPAAFKANNTLHMHKIMCHNLYTYQCSMCPRTYRCRHYAVKHLRAVHRVTAPVGRLPRVRGAPLAAGTALAHRNCTAIC